MLHPAQNNATCVHELLWMSTPAELVAIISGAFTRVVTVTLSVDNKPASLIVVEEFCMSFPVVVSKRAIALSVAEAGQTTSPVPAPSVPFKAIKSQYVTSVGRFHVVIAVQI